MVARERHLGGAHEVEVVLLEPVHLVGVPAEEAGACMISGRTSTGGIIIVNPFAVAFWAASCSRPSWSSAP